MVDLSSPVESNVTARAVVFSCHKFDKTIPLTVGDGFMIAIIAIFCVIIIIATLLDVCINVLELQHMPVNLMPFLQGFSFYHNSKKILNTSGGGSDSTNLACLNGMKYLSISWIVLGHVLWEYTNVSKFGAFTSSASATG